MRPRQKLNVSLLAVGLAGLIPAIALSAPKTHIPGHNGFAPVRGESCPPVISGCLESVDVNAAPGACTAPGNWVEPTAASGTCGSPVDSFTSNYLPTDPLPIGTTTVTYTARSGGFTNTCSFDVTVHGDTPVISCPPDVWTVHCNNPAGYVYTPIVTPDCDTDQLIITGDGDPFPFGTTEGVTATVIDANGHVSNTCTFTLNVLGDVRDPIRIQSTASLDGTVRQKKVGVHEGGYAAPTLGTIQVGDDGANLESMGILSFDLSNNPVPEGAIITEATLRLTRVGQAGHPEALGRLVVDLANPAFGANTLEPSDFEAPDTQYHVTQFTSTPAAGNSSCIYAPLSLGYLPLLNRTGQNQFRMHFLDGPSNNGLTDMYYFASGEASNAPITRPELIVEYYFPNCPTCGSGGQSGQLSGTATLTSIPAHDGYIKEAHWTSDVGYFANTTASTFNVGDTSSREQMIGLLSFNTSSIPVGASITSARLRLVRTGSTGNPAALGALAVDMRCDGGVYGALPAAEPSDFQAYSYLSEVGGFSPLPALNGKDVWASLNPVARDTIRRGEGAITQFKVHFTQPDNGNATADYMVFGSADGGTAARPQLVIEYTY